MRKLTLCDQDGSYDVTRLDVEVPARVVLFAVGGGGNPERHDPLLFALAEQGCSVIAPHFERMISPVPTDDELELRARRLRCALDSIARAGVPTVGIGHSIGAATLLALVGGELWTGPGHALSIASDPRLTRLALLAPATGFFRAPGALEAVQTPLCAWVGTQDTLTPPSQAEFLRDTLSPRVPVELHTIEDAGHFSFMHDLPPQVIDPLPDRKIFLDRMTQELVRFVLS